MKNLAERLTWAREQKGLTQAALAKLVGVSQSTIGNLESGLRQSARKIANIALALDVDALWLAEGRGVPRAKKATDPNIIEDDGTMIQERIESARAGAITGSAAGYNPVGVLDDGDYSIPMVELRLSAGVTGFQVDQPSSTYDGAQMVKVDRRFVEANQYIPELLLAVKVKGDSMEPKLSHGDTVIINTGDRRAVDGAVFAVNYEGEAVIKRLSRDAGEWWLMSDNPDQRKYHRKICRGGECIIVGRAVRAFTDQL